METVKIQLSELKPAEKNVRKHTPAQIDEFIKSINSFGVIRPIVVDEDNTILCGNGLYEALIKLGRDTADCKVVSGLSNKQKKKLMLADNKIYSIGVDDYNTIDEILAELGSEGDFEIPGYNPEILEELYGIKSVEASVQENKEKEVAAQQEIAQSSIGEVPTPTAHVQQEREKAMQRKVIICPHCGGTIEC